MYFFVIFDTNIGTNITNLVNLYQPYNKTKYNCIFDAL